MTRKTTSYARRQAKKSDWQRQRYKDVNHVKAAVVKNMILADIKSLRDECEMHAFGGSNAPRLCDLVGRLVFVTAHAAHHHGLHKTPEANILAGTAGALADIAKSPQQLETQRAAVISGLGAIERLMPSLDPFSLAQGALELDAILQKSSGLDAGDVYRILKD